jgi:hypothetical protein
MWFKATALASQSEENYDYDGRALLFVVYIYLSNVGTAIMRCTKSKPQNKRKSRMRNANERALYWHGQSANKDKQ